MRPEKDSFLYGYPDPSFALERLECLDLLCSLSDCPEASRVMDCLDNSSQWVADYPDPSLCLLAVEEEEMEMEEAFA